MRLSVIAATLEGCPAAALDDAALMTRVIDAAVEAGGLHLLHRHVHRFSPQGLTAMALLSESHIALHTWPEHGTLFVDIATCSAPAAARDAFTAVARLVPHTRVVRRRWLLEADGAAPAPELA